MKLSDTVSVWRCGVVGCFLLTPFTALADPIVVSEISGDNDAGTIEDYTMTAFDPITGTIQECIDSPLDGQICFEDRDSAPLGLIVRDAYDEGWWEFDHGNILATSTSWIEIMLPENTRAVSFWVGASFNGYAWLQAFDNSGNNSDIINFKVGPDNTAGYAVSTADSCNSISSIVVDPLMWGIGNFSINQDSCVSVPEPDTTALLLVGLLGFALLRRQHLQSPNGQF